MKAVAIISFAFTVFRYDESYSSNRRCALQDYLRCLVRIPFLRRRSATLKSFISFEFIEDTADIADSDYYRIEQARSEFYGGHAARDCEEDGAQESEDAMTSKGSPNKLHSSPRHAGSDRNPSHINFGHLKLSGEEEEDGPDEEVYEIAGEEGAQYSITNYRHGSPVPDGSAFHNSSSSSNTNSNSNSNSSSVLNEQNIRLNGSSNASALPYREGRAGSQSSEESEFDYNSRAVTSPLDYNSNDSDDEVEVEEEVQGEEQQQGGGAINAATVTADDRTSRRGVAPALINCSSSDDEDTP